MHIKKQFGQNFITDTNLIKKIVNLLGTDRKLFVIEIGPGRGALTKLLVQNYQQVVALEIDRDLEAVLKSSIPEKNFELLIGDILEIDLKKLIRSKNIDCLPVVIISNLPYYITSEILFKTFELHKEISLAIFMMQKEVAERLTAAKSSSAYNNLTVVSNYFADVKYEFTVKKNMFNPVPKVDSAIVSLNLAAKKVGTAKFNQEFLVTVRKLFNNRRKTILNNMENLNFEKDESRNILSTAGIDAGLRPENIGVEDFVKLVRVIASWK